MTARDEADDGLPAGALAAPDGRLAEDGAWCDAPAPSRAEVAADGARPEASTPSRGAAPLDVDGSWCDPHTPLSDVAQPTAAGAGAHEASPGGAVVPPLRHRRGGVLGRGGMGLVSAGFDPLLQRSVALKRPLAPGADGEARLLREARLAARLDHPAIVDVHDVGRDDEGFLSAVLPVRQGRSWTEAVAGAPADAAPPAALLRAMLAATQAVAHAHARGVVHRDLSPGNVRLGEDGAVWVLDWGLAATVDEAARGGFRGGTRGYAAPELVDGRPASPASDVWSLGALLHLACAGAPPAAARARPGRCPRALWAVCAKATADEPAARYPDAAALAADLERFLDGQPVAAHREGAFERAARLARRHPRAVAAALGALALVLLAATVAGVLVARAERQLRGATASLLLASAVRALHQDDVGNARRLAQQALATSESPRARGVLAATARVTPVQVTAGERPGCPAVDVWGGRAVCRRGPRLEVRGPAGAVVDLGPVDVAALLEGGWVLTASQAAEQVSLWAPDGRVVQTVRPSGGTPRLAVAPTRRAAVVFVAQQLVSVTGGEGPLALTGPLVPCAAGQPIRVAVAAPRGAVVVCGDDAVVQYEGARVASSRRVEALAPLLRGPTAAALLGDDALVLGSTTGRVGVLDLESLALAPVVPTGLGFIQHVAASADGRSVAVAGEHGVAVWRVREGQLLPVEALPGGEPGAVWGLAAAAPSGFEAFGEGGPWRLSPRARLAASTGMHGRAALAVHEASGRVAVGDAIGAVSVFHLDEGLVSGDVGRVRVIKSAAFSPSGRFLAAGGAGGDGVVVLDTQVTPVRRVEGPWTGNDDLRGRHVAFLGEDVLLFFGWGEVGRAARYDAAAGRFGPLLPTVPLRDARALSAVADAALVLGGDGGGRRLSSDGRGVAQAEVARFSPPPHTFAASVDGAWWATAEGAEVQRRRPRATRFDAGAPVEALAVSRDGRLAVCRRDGVVQLRSHDDALVLEVPAHDGRCGKVAFCDAERALCTVGWDGRLRVIEVGGAAGPPPQAEESSTGP